jgi:voltage-gated potassium channel
MSIHRFVAELPLITLTLWLQSAGVAALITWVRRVLPGDVRKVGAFRSTALVVRFAMAVVVLHGVEILLWAGFYRWRCLPSWDSAIYFSASSYSTLGCSDVSLPTGWRTLGPLESVIGVLMCGISVSLLFAIFTRLINREERSSPKQGAGITHRSLVPRNFSCRQTTDQRFLNRVMQRLLWQSITSIQNSTLRRTERTTARFSGSSLAQWHG